MPSKIITNGRLEYLEATINVTYPDIGKVTYRGSRPIIVSNQWAPPVKMPVKGDLIMLDGKQYRVLKINDTVAEVLAMYSVTSMKFDASGNSKVYANNSLDIYCNETFYNSLSTTIQNAIVVKTFQQDSWYYSPKIGNMSGNPKYIGHSLDGSNDYGVSLGSATFGTNILRKCYVISVQDIIDYLEVTPSMTTADTTLTDENIRKMFWNQTTWSEDDEYEYPWLCSADVEFNTVFYIDCINTGLLSGTVANPRDVRPAFQIDLNKIEWTKA